MADNKDYQYKSSQDVVAPHLDPLAGEDAKRAEEAGVKDSAYVDYEEALKNYESRPDVETLAARRAREGGWKFEDAAFRRSAKDDELTGGGVVTSDDATSKEAEQKSATTARKSSK
ncbi:hypothetical protein HWB79_gp091 [Streptomyces phage LukeCage]|jgi:hypothetical protein|uniref:Uncharacterized protein n=1 Tax=Streptomyces phage LukeCage TaxID=2283304 RepID=A0A345MGN8_9CAUD|nr:hypothetical protein HWB79_gp091 [Streptomyces phage LukeCage]AXH69719.1 hypothetical protein SEA_LUKECAGE_236 [Streptomyces phage LukeCage]